MQRALGATRGENIREYLRKQAQNTDLGGSAMVENAAFPACLCELVSRSGRRRLGHCSPPSEHSGERVISIYQPDFSVLVESYMRWTLGLTATEVDIARLTLQRASPREIAELRRIRLNTVRTHINSVIRKFGCNSITEVIAAIYELNAIPESHLCDETGVTAATPRHGSILRLHGSGMQVEYYRYGPEGGRPLVLLHSIDYGVAPPKEFLNAAAERKYTTYLLIRPGFGRSTPAHSLRSAAETLNLAISSLGLRDAVVISMSSAGPVALELSRICRRIDLLVCVNFLTSKKDKLRLAKPDWVRGILDLANWSPESFRYALKMTRGVIRIAGSQAIFRSIYAGQPWDLAYAEDHATEIDEVCKLILGAADESLRLDLTTSFHNPADIEAANRLGARFYTVFGENAHGVTEGDLYDTFNPIGFQSEVMKGAGRNCAFQKPHEFLSIVDRRLAALAGEEGVTTSA
jgi:DNA-binding CsgD family transcriptional regulator/pimeloyl-ACP methyl ester carboxylesterase